MRAARPDDAAAVRLRTAAPIAALVLPALVLLAAGVNESLPCDALSCQRLEHRTLVLVWMAAPLFGPLRALLDSLLAAVVVGVAVSAVVWLAVGRLVLLLTLVSGRPTWRRFFVRYGAVAAAWAVAVALVD